MKNGELDRIDLEILRLLQEDCRRSNKDLAGRVGLSPSSCLERVRRLRETGVIRGFHAEIDPAAIGVGLQAMVAARIRSHSPEDLAALREHLTGLAEVVATFYVTGRADFLIHLAVRDAEHLRRIISEDLVSRPEIVRLETSLMFEEKRGQMPILDDPAERI